MSWTGQTLALWENPKRLPESLINQSEKDRRMMQPRENWHLAEKVRIEYGEEFHYSLHAIGMKRFQLVEIFVSRLVGLFGKFLQPAFN